MSALIEYQSRMIQELIDFGYPKDIVRDILIQTNWDRDAALSILQQYDWDNHDVMQAQPQVVPQQQNVNLNSQVNSQANSRDSGMGFMNGYDEQQQIQLAINQSLNKQEDQPASKRMKQKQLPLGLQNYGNTCYLSCLIQVFFYNPVLVKLVLQYKIPANQDQDGKQHIKFLGEVQKMFVRMILRNEKYLKSQDIFEAAQLIDYKNEKLNRGDFKDVNEYFQCFLESMDKTLEKNFRKQQALQGFLNKELDQQYYIQTNKVSHLQLLLMNWEKIKNIYDILYQQQEEIACEIQKLPENLILNVNRVTEIIDKNKFQNKNADEIILKPVLHLDFLIGKSQKNEYFKNQKNGLYAQNLQSQKECEAFERTYKYFQNQPIVQSNVLESLRVQLEIKKQQIQSGGTLEEELAKNSKIIYHLAQVIIHVGSVNSGHYYLYQYNFYLQKWIKYNDTMVEFKSEIDVMVDIGRNCNIVIYISEQQKKRVHDFQRELIEIEQQRDQGKDVLNSNIVNNETLKMIPLQFGMQALEENERFMMEYNNFQVR